MAEECNSCHAPIDWAVKFPEEMNDRDMPRTIPIDHGSVDDPKGNIAVWRGQPLATNDGIPGPALLYARYLKKGEEPKPGEHRGISHFATCAQADQWRSRRRA